MYKLIGTGDIKNVIYSIYGKDVTEGLLPVDYTYEDIKISGMVGKPEIARGNRSYQMFYVNNRYIKDKTLSSATEQAYKGLLQVGKYGFLVLKIEIDPSKIDVNVHPTKLEIRFEEEQKVFKAVFHSIKESLLKGDLIQNVDFGQEEITENKVIENIEEDKIAEKEEFIEAKPIEQISGETVEEEKMETMEVPLPNLDIEEKAEVKSKIPSFINIFKKKNNGKDSKKEDEEKIEENDVGNNIAEIFNKKNENEEREKFEVPSEEKIDKIIETLNMKDEKQETISRTAGKPGEFTEMYEETFGKILDDAKNKKYKEVEDVDTAALKQTENISVFEEEETYSNEAPYKFVGLLFSTYIVIEIDQEIYIIDQHAAHERIIYEQVKENFYSDMEKDSQIMLLPDIITLSHKEKEIVNENVDLYKKAGFMFEEFGDNTIRLVGVPTICMELDTKELFKEILDEINTVAITATKEKEDKFISTIACKAAIKANMRITKEEVDSLMKELLKLPNPFTCPHGRPTAIRMAKLDIEKKFGRK